ncbi:MAG: glycosyltransferase family 39 protein [Anaerolineae bacterium]|nr:glycosyltransferase family 39 protein [Anaerolineae bacterium]
MHTQETLRAEASRKEREPAEGCFILLAALAALAWRLRGLDLQPLWWDEGWSVYFAVADVPEMMRLTAVDIHPPLYYLLLHAWVSLFGPSVLSVRFLSVLIGVAAVPLIYMVGRRLVDRRLGAATALLLTFSPLHIYYSQEVRMYGLVTLAGLAALYFALAWRTSEDDLVRGRMGAGTWAGYVASAAAALYTQYYATFLLLALNVLVVGGWWRRRSTRRDVVSWLSAQAAVVALYLPWLWYAGPRLVTYVSLKVGIEQDPSLGLLTYLARHLAAFQWGHAEGALADWWWVGLAPLLLVLVALSVWRPRRRQPGNATAIAWPLGIVAVALICGFVVNLVLPFNPPRLERMLLFALPACLLVCAIPITWLVPEEKVLRSRAGRVGVVAVAVGWLAAAVVSLHFFYTVPRYPADDYRPVADQVAALSTPEDAIVCVHPWQAGYFYTYLPNEDMRPTVALTPREAFSREEQLWVADPARMAADLDTLLAAHGRVWLADHQAMGRVLEEQIEAYLVTHAYPVLKEWHGENTILSLFSAGAPLPAGVSARLGDWLALDGAMVASGPLPAATGVVPVEMAWQVLAPPPGDYRVGLRLVGATGHVWAQRDARPLGGLASFADWPVGEPLVDRHGLLVPGGTPPGDYRVTVRVYDEGDLSVLPAAFAGGSGGEVDLGVVRVGRPSAAPPIEALTYGQVMTLAQRVDVEFGPLQLLGYTVAMPTTLLPGEAVDVALFWQARTDPGEDYFPLLRLVDLAGNTVAEVQEKPVAGTYPTAWWQAGDLVRDPHALRIPAAVDPGEYELAAGLVRAANGQPMGDLEAPLMVLGRVVVEGRGHVYTSPQPAHVQQSPLGERVTLVGYDLTGVPAEPGGALRLVLHWRTLDTPDRHYHAFVHLLDPGGIIVAQADGVPGEGGLPTVGWLPGEYIADPHTVLLPMALPPGTYRLAVGLYEPVSGYRPAEPILLDTPIVIDP